MIIVIEGGDQAGKKTQSELLVKALKRNKIKTKLFSFPDYSTSIGKEINKHLLGKRKYTPQALDLLYSANRWEKLDKILDAHKKNSILVMNRYYHSNFVYGVVNGAKLDWLENLDAGLPKPDLVILLDTKLTESFKRKKRKRDTFEKDKTFSNKVLNTYRSVAKKKKWKIIDATQTKEEVHNDIMKIFAKKLKL